MGALRSPGTASPLTPCSHLHPQQLGRVHSPGGTHPSPRQTCGPHSQVGRTCCFALETSTASWLCNVHSQAWPAALGCPSAVMGPAYVFRRPERENSGRRGGPRRATTTQKPTAQLLARALSQGRSDRAEVYEHNPCLPCCSCTRRLSVPGESGRPWLLGLPSFPPSFRAWTHGQGPFLWADVLFLLCGVRPATGGGGRGRCLEAK